MNLKIFTSIIVVLFSCFTLIGQKTSQNINDFELFLPLEVGWKFDDGSNYQIKLINKAKRPPRFLIFYDITDDVASNNAKIYTDYPFNDETGIHYFMYKDTTTKEFTLDSLVGYHLMLNVDWDSLNNKFKLKILGVAPTFTNNGVYEKMFWIKNNADSIGSGNTDFIWNNDDICWVKHITLYDKYYLNKIDYPNIFQFLGNTAMENVENGHLSLSWNSRSQVLKTTYDNLDIIFTLSYNCEENTFYGRMERMIFFIDYTEDMIKIDNHK